MAEHNHSRDGPTPQDYYDGFTSDRGSLKDRFKNIDEQVHFDNSVQQLSDPHTKNFVLDFGNDDAFCAMNLETEDLKLLLKKPVCNSPLDIDYESRLRD